jgi:type VI secretion system secreted protein VgrG
MPKYTQAGRPLVVTTPLPPDTLLLVDLKCWEEISRPYTLDLELLAELDAAVEFDKLLGQPVGVEIAFDEGTTRPLHGICRAIEECESDTRFRRYRMEVVPKVWTLTLRRQSRIFQGMTVPDVLAKVFTGFDVSYRLSGVFQPRDYVVQYRESDFDFASRLMEEEGIYYWFKYTKTSHTMVVANTPQGHDDVDGTATMTFEGASGGWREAVRVVRWEKRQELRSGKLTHWDHCFEMPGKNLESTTKVADTVQGDTVTHKLLVGGNDTLEQYDYPGGYAQRFDGIAPGGGDRAADLGKIAEDGTRTVRIRAQEESAPAVVVAGDSNCVQFSAGRKFKLKDHGTGDGPWVLTAVGHRANCAADYSSGSDTEDFVYSNTFRCLPFAAPFRPARATPRPIVRGCQTAVVVGPSGEEIFTDKYGRVKVQFPWDREGKKDTASSCWIRVATIWAGRQWGAIHIPRIGQEVVVDFLEGDPDQPIIVGSVYNAEQMPPYALPDNKTQSGVKSRSTLKGSTENFNELRFEDKKGSEEIYFHAEKNFTRIVENDDVLKVGLEKKDTGSQTIEIHKDRTETVNEGNEKVTIKKGNRTVTVETGDDTHKVSKGNRTVEVKTNDTWKVEGNRQATVLGTDTTEVTKEMKVTCKKTLTIEATDEIKLKCGMTEMSLKKDGTFTLKGMKLGVTGDGKIDLASPLTTVKGDGTLTLSGGMVNIN